MIGICKLSLLIFISLFISCNELGDYYGKDKYQAYHLINTYVDADSPQIRVQNKEIIIFFRNKFSSNVCYSAEFANVIGVEQSKEQLTKFISLANKNNDHLKWIVSYRTHGYKNNMHYYADGSLVATTKGIINIDLVSNTDFDEKHPAGTSLMDIVTLKVDTFGDMVGIPLDKLDVWCYKSKNYSLYTKKELSIIGEELCLRFNTHPKNSKKLNFIATITFDDGEVFSDIVEVEF